MPSFSIGSVSRSKLGAAFAWADLGILRCSPFAVTPGHASTSFGYLELGEALGQPGPGGQFRNVRKFVEKPDAATAQGYLLNRDFAWNAGMFVWQAATFLREAEANAPELAAFIREFPAGDPAAYLAARFPALPKISVDYAIMEKASRVATLVADFGTGTMSGCGRPSRSTSGPTPRATRCAGRSC